MQSFLVSAGGTAWHTSAVVPLLPYSFPAHRFAKGAPPAPGLPEPGETQRVGRVLSKSSFQSRL